MRQLIREHIIAIVLWQLLVYALCVGGVFVEIYDLLGIPWNSVGPVNVFGTCLGLLLLELPLILFLGFRARASTHAQRND